MPYIDFGEEMNFSNKQTFRKLKSKGDKLVFRILSKPYFEGKHFIKDNGKWNIVPCIRVNLGESCNYCTTYFKKMQEAKEKGLTKVEADKLTRPYKTSVFFYFPILNRETESFEILQTTAGVRRKIENIIKLGVDVLNSDLVLLRTEMPGNYYELTKVDSADVKKFTNKEKQEIERAKKIDLEKIITGSKDENSGIEESVEF